MARWIAAVALIAVLTVAAPAHTAAGGATAATGVRLGTLDVTGWTAADLRAYLKSASAELTWPAVDARVDPDTKGLVPGLDGLQLNVDATAAAILKAGPGTEVGAVFRRVPPQIALGQLAPAPVYRGNRAKQAVALLINVAWGEEFVAPLLHELAAAHAPATFCLVGRWAERHPDLVRRMAADRYGFCNHGYTDHGWANIGRQAAERSIARADAVITRLTGQKPIIFSPHKGEWNRGVLTAAAATGHTLVLWSRDTIDWQQPSVARVLERTVGRARGGDIVLMHPTAVTVAALPAMIRGLRARGLRLLTVRDLLSPDPWAGTPR